VILVDPYPRTADQIFFPGSRARLEALSRVTWHEGPPAGSTLVEPLLPELVAIVGQTALPAERLERAPRLRAVVNVEGNFLPNIDYPACFARGIDVLGIGPVFGPPVAELALGLALALAAARDIPR
jgi:phosphoglycerate dehydrogenase-like enzyme